jgi:hypothetical protein
LLGDRGARSTCYKHQFINQLYLWVGELCEDDGLHMFCSIVLATLAIFASLTLALALILP